MLPPFTDAELDAFEALANAATHGPWIVAPEHCDDDGQGVYTDPGAECCGAGKVCEVGDPYARGCNNPEESMRFIAASRAWAPLLIGEVRRLRAELAKQS